MAASFLVVAFVCLVGWLGFFLFYRQKQFCNIRDTWHTHSKSKDQTSMTLEGV